MPLLNASPSSRPVNTNPGIEVTKGDQLVFPKHDTNLNSKFVIDTEVIRKLIVWYSEDSFSVFLWKGELECHKYIIDETCLANQTGN